MITTIIMTTLSLLSHGHQERSECVRKANISMGDVWRALLANYDHWLPPTRFEPTNVTVELHIQEVTQLSELTSTLELDLMFSEIWLDSRLSFRATNLSYMCAKDLILRSELRQKIWTPETCIINSKTSEVHASPNNNTFLILDESGQVWSNWRLRISVPCHFDFRAFPFDIQHCSIHFTSLLHNLEQIHIKWHEHPVTLMDKVELPDFSLVNFSINQSEFVHTQGRSDSLMLKLHFERRYGFYLLHGYFPSTMTVFCSWVGFTFSPTDISARVTLGFSAFLALNFQFSTLFHHLPRVSYVKGSDVWMLACILYVFGTLPQNAIVYHLGLHEKEMDIAREVVDQWLFYVNKRQTKRIALCKEYGMDPEEVKIWWIETCRNPAPAERTAHLSSDQRLPPIGSTPKYVKGKIARKGGLLIERKVPVKWTARCYRWGLRARHLDTGSITMFPTTFSLFNIYYWSYYFFFDWVSYKL